MAQNYGDNQINWGQWQSMPDYRAGMVNKNRSAIGAILKMDPTSKWNPVSKTLHEGEDRILTGANQVLAPILKFESETGGQADPIRQTLSQIAPETHKQYQDWWNNHGADIAAIAALTYVTGGAGTKAAVGAGETTGATAAPAASGSSLSTGGLAGSTAATTNAITPALAYAGGVAEPVTAGSVTGGGILSASAPGTLGAVGTNAALQALTPAFATYGASTGAGSAALKGIRQANAYRANINTIKGTDTAPSDKQRYNAMAEQLSQQILKSGEKGPQNDKMKKMANQIYMNRFARGY